MRSSVKLICPLRHNRSGVIRQRMRGACLQFVENQVANAPRIAAQLRIPKAQRFDAARLQKFFPFQIMLSLVGKTVLAAVQFNVQFCFLAKEIKIVITERMLAAEFVAAEPPGAQPAPYQLLCPRFLLAELTGADEVGHDGEHKPEL